MGGATQHPVGTNSASFTTPPLAGTARYWVRGSNGLGSADSDTAIITAASASAWVYLPFINK